MAVNKPAGILAHPDQNDDPASADLVSAIKQQLDLGYVGLHQRLDREVSGVMLLATEREVNAALAQVFEGRVTLKEYIAVVLGCPKAKSGTIKVALSPKPDKNGRYNIVPEGIAAVTHYRVEAVAPDKRWSVVRLRLETGRTHQLRAHMRHIGCPIIGDGLYGKGNFPRLLLHAERLSLPHPVSQKLLELVAPMPPIIKRALEAKALPEVDLATELAQIETHSYNQTVQSYRLSREGLYGLLRLAEDRRMPLQQDPQNTAYRLLNGAADGLPGITLDRFDRVLVLSFYDPSIDLKHSLLELLTDEIKRIWSDYSLYVKFRPRTAARIGEADKPEFAPTVPLCGEVMPEITVQENGLNYLIKPSQGLSVGLFLDMREMRGRVRAWAENKTVLNCFSYTSGFGVAALAGGAKRVLNLDAARTVLEWGKANYAANNLAVDDFDFVDGDVFDWLGRFGRKQQQFDIVILDPPSFATTKKSRFAAEKNYDELVKLAAPIVTIGGMLVACSNHAGLERRIFRRMVVSGLKAANRPAQSITAYNEPTLDFPHLPQAEGYLKVLVCQLK